VLTKLQDLWSKTKKGADVTIVFDKSGSMAGAPLKEAKAGARAFVQTLGDRDQGSLLFFDSEVYPAFGPLPLATGRNQLFTRIDGVAADGGTALYDAIAAAYDAASQRAVKDPAEIHAVVVMTDGADENSKMTLPQLAARFPKEESLVKVFTIAYGQEAQSSVLDQIAEAAKGSSARGSVETIRDVYRDMASFF
jgi:Ca-activated chloride channel family protein